MLFANNSSRVIVSMMVLGRGFQVGGQQGDLCTGKLTGIVV